MRRSKSMLLFLAAACLAAALLSGCAVHSGPQEKLRDLEFTFRMTYTDQGSLYIAEGYGAQPTTGYSVEVTGLYETEDEVRIHTRLMGPEKGEEIKEITTFPYVTVQLGAVDKSVIFE